jgi:hypothetical protein
MIQNRTTKYEKAANQIWSLYLLKMIQPVIKTFTTLHYTCRHFISSHLNFTQLHFTALSFGLTPSKFPTAPFHLTSLQFTFLCWHRGEMQVKFQPVCNSALEGGGWSAPCFGRFTPRKDLVPIAEKAGWASRSVRMVRKVSSPTEYDPRTFQSATRPYTTVLPWPPIM